ncbi:MAG: sulfite exporter TauE/SafE family protein [Bacteroidota bacterium]|jgi:nickel/cobalt exporter|nr:sulfite exporter TauE/SafE family protein [Bacteroidota bacterium]MCA6442759.1 sulfite exporter TauE/SafE family protein [Bacteroidota bacterium]
MNSSIAIFSSFFLGALHAFEPGHGKTALATYTLGNNITTKQLLQLGLTVFCSHVLVLLGIGLALHFFYPEADLLLLVHKFKIMVPVLTILIGIYLFIKHKKGHQNCNCVYHKKPTNIAPHSLKKVDFKHLKLTASEEEIAPIDHTREHAITSIGFVSGILPCPTALAVFISSLSNLKIIDGCINLIIYALGFAVMMCSLAILMSLFRKKFQGYISHSFSNHIAVYSAIVIVLIGLIQLIDILFVKN